MSTGGLSGTREGQLSAPCGRKGRPGPAAAAGKARGGLLFQPPDLDG
jgi:hypothetical protein